MYSTPIPRGTRLPVFCGIPCAAALLAVGAVGIIADGAPPGSLPPAGREDCNFNGVEDDQDIASWGTAFDDVASWAAFDAGDHGVGTDPDGYWGGVFDGRYVYFAPYNNGTIPHGEVMRYDTQGDFAGAASWETFDAGAHGVGDDPDAYAYAIFDGRYVYFVPFRQSGIAHGEVLRFDTNGPFGDTDSWAAFDPGDHGVGTDPDGYIGGAFDGRYIYFAPYDNGTVHHSEVLRYDTTGVFEDVDSWATFDPRDYGVNDDYGYGDAIFDGRYVYFVPNCTHDTNHHGEVLRFDTTGDFFDPASWEAFDPGDHGVGYDPDGYHGAAFDGRYVYFVPGYREPGYWHGEVLRYDTQGDFGNTDSWATFDPGAAGVGYDPEGYAGGFFDGRFVYFVPAQRDSGPNDEFLRYDTQGSFADVAAWDAFRPRVYGVGDEGNGFCGAIYDGRYLYFSPLRWSYPHGEVMRYDIAAIGSPDCNGNGIPDECDIDDQTSGDCNGNGVPDECDIAGGFSRDDNDNGIPDECEDSCPADVNDDDAVNIDDLFAVLGAWGPCSDCPEDVNGDGVVNIDDIFDVLGAWGPCP
ncbi:MAG: hypothetical protein JSV91_12680 [Phycisphaerales bacterium]|nr:MAG: hypothetical protein JSV91_12680 [Phycisphaerales bacterium]